MNHFFLHADQPNAILQNHPSFYVANSKVCKLFTFIVHLIQKWKIQQPFDRAIGSACVHV